MGLSEASKLLPAGQSDATSPGTCAPSPATSPCPYSAGIPAIQDASMSLDSMLGWNSRRLSAPPSSVGNGASNTISARRHPTRASIGSPQSVSKWARRSSFNYESRKSEGSERTELKRLLSEFGSVQPLSQVEICIVKDVWNKWLAWKSMHTEFVVERLFYLHPELLKCLGPAAALMPELFPAIMDLCVRDLQPHTENVARESYGPIHPAIGTAKTAFASKVDYFTLFAEMKISCAHWEELRGLFLDSVLASPYMEAYELDDCNTGPSSAIWRFFTLHVMAPAYERAEALSALMVAPGSSTLLVNSWVVVGRSNDALQNLMKGCVELSPHVDVGKVRQLALRLLSGLDTAVNWFPQWNVLLPLLHRFEDTHVTLDVVGDREPGQFSRDLAEVFMGLVARCSESVTEVWRHVLHRVFLVLIVLPATAHQRLQKDAFEWLQLMSTEFGWSDEKLGERKAQVLSELLENGTYTHTQEELVHGARVAWRNSAKCIGRITWKALHVRDMRHINDPDAMFNQILEHHKVATDGESIAAVATVFRARHSQERFGPRFWSPQFVRFACHEMEDGSLLGDKANLQLTRAALSLGWRPPATKTEFDALPFIIEHPSGGPRMYNVPAEEARYIAIEHPHYPAVKELNLKWCSVPTISNFGLRLGGLDYSLVFNGWFMCTEIARDLFEENRMDKAGPFAQAMGLDTQDNSFWRDQAFLELNRAVMYSFQKEASTIVDHHTCSKQFLTHDEREKRCGREVPAQWSWIVPPLSSSLTGVFHHEMRDFHLTPEYVYQANMWEIKAKGSKISDSSLHAGHDSFSAKVLILWSSETGTAERFAKLAKHTMERYMECDARSLAGLRASDLASLSSDYLAVLFIVSTFGDGAPPSDGVDLHSSLNTLVLSEAAPAPEPLLSKLRFSVLALGSSLYPHFCGFGLNLDSLLLTCGAFSLLPPTLADELKGQAATFQTWMSQVTHVLGVEGGGGNASAATPISPLHFISKLELTASAEGTSGKVDDAYFSCSVRKNVELLFGRAASEAREGSDTTRMIEIDMSGTPLTYETGDHLQIMPCNSQATVVAMLKHLHLRGNEWVAEGKKGSMSLLPVAFPVQVGTLLSRAIDLSSTEASLPGFLNLLRVRSKDERDLEYVQGLLNRWASQSHRQSLLAEFPTILHLLQVCTSAQLELGDLALLPVLKPRLYSISSAAECMPHTVQLTVKVIREGSSVGLCSNFLAGLAPGSSTVMARIHTSSFRLPSDLSSPLILVGAGTGIAPLIAFLRRREHAKFQQGAQLGPCLVYFGCRDPDYFLYRQQLQRWRWMGVITDLQVAYSRAHGKVYVQDLIFSQKVKVWRLLSLPTTHSFVCGDAAIAQAVQLEFCHIASETGGMESCLVGKWFKSLQESGRYTADAWGMKKPRKDEDLVVVRTSVYKPRHHPPSCSAM